MCKELYHSETDPRLKPFRSITDFKTGSSSCCQGRRKHSKSGSGVETGGAGGALAPPLFCHAVSNENNMKNIEITNGLIFKKYVAFLTSRLPMILCP